MDIAAGVATDGEANGNTAAPQLSLGFPYDFDGNEGISKDEAIPAIVDYFAGRITKAQTNAVIVLYFSTSTEPGPGPNEAFVSVSAGRFHTCGVKRDGSVACWGWNRSGQAAPRAGEFASVSAGERHTCGVKRDGSVACWGNGQTAPPAGEFASGSAGSSHTCWVRRDRSVVCWGLEGYGHATPPAGEFSSVSAGGPTPAGWGGTAPSHAGDRMRITLATWLARPRRRLGSSPQ